MAKKKTKKTKSKAKVSKVTSDETVSDTNEVSENV